MSKRILIWLFGLVLVASACARGGQPGAQPTASLAAQPGQPEDQSTRQPGCTVQTRQSTPNPTLQAMLPVVNEKDWVQGPDDAYVTIIEYSDFQ